MGPPPQTGPTGSAPAPLPGRTGRVGAHSNPSAPPSSGAPAASTSGLSRLNTHVVLLHLASSSASLDSSKSNPPRLLPASPDSVGVVSLSGVLPLMWRRRILDGGPGSLPSTWSGTGCTVPGFSQHQCRSGPTRGAFPNRQFKPCGVLAQEGGHQMRRSQFICFYQYLFIHLNKGSLVLQCAHMGGPHRPPIITLFTQSHRVLRPSFWIAVPNSGLPFLVPDTRSSVRS